VNQSKLNEQVKDEMHEYLLMEQWKKHRDEINLIKPVVFGARTILFIDSVSCFHRLSQLESRRMFFV